MVVEMTVGEGVIGLLASARSTSSFTGVRYYLKGDLCQMAAAKKEAGLMGIQTGQEGVQPFVTSKEDFDRLKKRLISRRIEGWWNYVTNEEFCEITGEYYFNGRYLGYQEEIRQIAYELDIQIKEDQILFATSKEDFNAIVEKLNIAE